MTDNRGEILSLLAQLSAMAPDVRLGQLMAHLGWLGEAHQGKGLAEIEDDELAALMVRHLGELNSRQGASPMVARAEAAQGYSARPA
jgi:hypothetical protein